MTRALAFAACMGFASPVWANTQAGAPVSIPVTATVVSLLIIPLLACTETACRDEWNQCYAVPENGNTDELQPVPCEEVSEK